MTIAISSFRVEDCAGMIRRFMKKVKRSHEISIL
jgi:hypothetical protein